ncbi:pilus assembly protein [Chloroflexia bacterium SDU3-3]|nr:pilus assembly protein [Chloroflexia bacterium SDU3-3]
MVFYNLKQNVRTSGRNVVMRHHTHKGQSIVEMALLLPLMLVVIMGIIDFGWYVYGYATVYMAARSAAEEATMLPPMTTRVGVGKTPDMTDVCVSSIVNKVVQTGPLFADIGSPNNIEISYPTSIRAPGEPIQVKLTYTIRPLTPLWQMVPIGNKGAYKVVIATRRTVEVLGENPKNYYSPNLTACS